MIKTDFMELSFGILNIVVVVSFSKIIGFIQKELICA
jgi:hypothetical protein